MILHLSKKHKKLLLLSTLSSLLLLAITAAVAAGVRSSRRGPRRLSPATHALVESSCGSTRYPDLCYSTVATAPSHMVEGVSTQRDVIALSLNRTTAAVEHNYFSVERLVGAAAGAGGRRLSPRERNALHDCLETISSTLDELRAALLDLQSYPNKAGKSMEEYADDMKTLISSAMTNQETCLDGFSHADADRHVRASLEGGQLHVERMCSNSLAMITNLTDADLAAQAGAGRRLGGDDGWPRWMSGDDRRRLAGAGAVAADAVVAADGSGTHRTVAAAVEAAPTKSKRRHVILIKAGVYRENVVVSKKKTNLMFVGEGRSKTIITGSKNVVDGSTTYDSATVAIMGAGFLARDLTFQNTAGPSKHQAVALRVGADLSAFYQCDILAYQDTLYVHNNRQFYINCLIAGTVDFIFGNAAVVFQDCDIHARKPGPGQKNMVTAQSRTDPNQNTGIMIQKSRIGGTADLQAAKGGFPTYLGRPWKEFSRTVVMQSAISDVIHPAGWHEWEGDFAIDTLHYAEYKNSGPGAATSGRVKWKGVRVITDPSEAQNYAPGEFIAGATWLRATGFPFSLGL